MKKNYFYTTVQEEFSLLLSAVRCRSEQEISALKKTCFSRHKTLCLHLLRDFITPIAREDLYEISAAIFAVFSTVFPFPDAEYRLAEQSVLLLSSDPFRLDETRLRLREELKDLWGDLLQRSAKGKSFYFAMDHLAEKLLIAAIKNA